MRRAHRARRRLHDRRSRHHPPAALPRHRDGQVRVSVETVDTPQPQPHQVLVRVEAAPLNPSDLGLLLALADPGTAKAGGTPDGPVVTAPVPEAVMPSLRARVGSSMPVGNEAPVSSWLPATLPRRRPCSASRSGSRARAPTGSTRWPLHGLPPVARGREAAAGASSFVNPFTALGMVETMRREGHSALVHTAAASNLGQMLNRVCLADGIELVNVVRRPEQADLLRELGARHVVDSSTESFMADLVEALTATGATMAFDAVGGGRLASEILNAMEAAVTDPARRTAGMAPTYPSRSTCTADWTGGRRNSGAASGSPGASADGCSCPSSAPWHPRTSADPAPRRRRADHHLRQPLHRGDLAGPGAGPRRPAPLRTARHRREVPADSPALSARTCRPMAGARARLPSRRPGSPRSPCTHGSVHPTRLAATLR